MEIFGIPIRDFAAFWGAALSTLLVLAKLLHPRPIVSIRAIDSGISTPNLRVKITNLSKHPVILGKVRTYGMDAALQAGSIDSWVTKDVIYFSMSNRLNILIEPSKTLNLDLVYGDKPKWFALILTWHSHRMIAWPLFPGILLRGKKAIQAMEQHPAKED